MANVPNAVIKKSFKAHGLIDTLDDLAIRLNYASHLVKDIAR